MLDVSQSVQISCAPEEVYQLITDLESTPQWSSAIVRIVRHEEGPLKVGHTFTEEATLMGRTIRTTKVIKALEPPHSYAEEATGGLMPHAVRMTLEPVGGGTRLTFRLSGNPGRAAKLYGPLLGRALKGQIAKDLKAMKRLLERSA